MEGEFENAKLANRAACKACPHVCTPAEGRFGRCGARRNIGGKVNCDNYGRITSLALDPIEKKPIARWQSGTTVLSLGSYGCSMDCPFCQNSSIARAGADDVVWREMAPEEVIEQALALKRRRCIGIAYTYNEPLVSWEFVRDTAQLAHEAGLANVLVSNGMATEAVLDEVAPLVDAANIDLKCFSDEGYRALGGDFETVKRTIETFAALPTCHLEVTTLAVPGISDDDAQMDATASWLASVDPAIPYHITRFFPQHRMRSVPPTPIAALRRLADIAAQHMGDVMLGNV